MIKSKKMFFLLIFTLVLAFGLQTLTATDINSNSSQGLLGDESSSGDSGYLSQVPSSDGYNQHMNDKKANTNKKISKTSIDDVKKEANVAIDEDESDINYLDSKKKSNDDFLVKSGNLKASNQKQSLSIAVDDLSCNVNDHVLINVQFNSSDVYEGVLIFYVDDDVVATHNLSHSDNTLAFDTYGYDVGLHDIYVEYTASLIYESADTHAVLEINRHPARMENFTSQFTDDNDIKLSFDLLSDDGYVMDASIGLYHDGNLLKNVNLNDSTNSIIVSSSLNGEIIRIFYAGDEYYESLEDYQLINVDKRHLSIFAPSVTSYHSSQSEVSVTINNDTKIVDGVIELYVDDLLVYRENVTSDKCVIPLDLTAYVEGVYELKIVYIDSDVFEQAEYTTTLKVNRIKTVIYANNITAYKNAPIYLKASVYNYVDDTDEGLIEFFLDDETIQTAQVTNNTVSYEYIIPDILSYGQHELKIRYYGSDKYQESEINTTLTLNKYKTTLYIKNTTIDDDGLININLNLYSYNQSVDDGRVDCYINGQLVASGDVLNNTARIILPDEFGPNTIYEVMLKYTNSDYFNDSTVDSTLEQNKTATTLTISKYLSTTDLLNVTVYVYAKDYSSISEGSVDVYLNGSLIDRLDIINNTAYTSYDMSDYPAANYTLQVEYAGSKRYDSTFNSTVVEKIITPKTIYINTQSSIKTTPGQNITIRANLTDYESTLITDTINATVKINNQTFSTTFNAGVMQVDLTAPDDTGRYTIEIITENTTYYKKTQRNITLNINRNSTYISAPNSISSLKLEEILLNLTLNDNNGLLRTKTPLQIKIDDKTIYQGFFNNGTAVYKLKLNTSYTQSQYTLTAIAGQTKTYSSTSKNITIKLQNRKTYIKSENIYSKKGDEVIFTAHLYDTLTHERINKTIPVVIKLNDLTILTTNATNGKIIATHPNEYNNENYTITIKSATTGLYESSQWTGLLINKRDSIKVSAKNIYANANSTITIRATIYKEGRLTTERIPVAVKINNLTIKTMNVTNSQIEFQYKLPDNLSQSEYNITIVTADTENSIQSATDFKLFVRKNYQQINLENITATASDTINIRANITDKNLNIIRSNSLVNIKIAGLTIANINATDGIIDYNYTLSNLKRGYYDLIVKTGETNCYMHATSQCVLKIE